MVVKYAYLPVLGLRPQNLGLLRHVPSLVDLSLMIYLHIYRYSRLFRIRQQLSVIFILLIVTIGPEPALVGLARFAGRLRQNVRTAHAVGVVIEHVILVVTGIFGGFEGDFDLKCGKEVWG